MKSVGDQDPEFLDVVFERMSDKDSSVRYAAVECLAKIGNERHTAPVVVLLLDAHAEVRNAAAKTLAAIGGKSDVVVFDMLLKNAEVYHHKGGQRILVDFDVEHFTKYKAELEARLKKQDEAKEKK